MRGAPGRQAPRGLRLSVPCASDATPRLVTLGQAWGLTSCPRTYIDLCHPGLCESRSACDFVPGRAGVERSADHCVAGFSRFVQKLLGREHLDLRAAESLRVAGRECPLSDGHTWKGNGLACALSNHVLAVSAWSGPQGPMSASVAAVRACPLPNGRA